MEGITENRKIQGGDKRDRMDRKENLCTILYKNGFNLVIFGELAGQTMRGPKTGRFG
jgi:hypothetical protein